MLERLTRSFDPFCIEFGSLFWHGYTAVRLTLSCNKLIEMNAMRDDIISVIIPTYNNSRYINSAVKSVLDQTYEGHIEIIIVDDGSEDDTKFVLDQYRNDINYIYQSNQGTAAARNRGIKEAKGEFLAFLDADDLWEAQKIQKQWEYLIAEPKVGFIHTDCIYWDDNSNTYFQKNHKRHLYSGNCYRYLFEGSVIHTSSVIIRRECLDKVGLFDEKMRSASEDYDLWLRISRHFEFAYISQPTTIYRYHANNATKNTLGMAKGELAVILKTLKENPVIWQELGKLCVKKRLFKQYFDIGYQLFDQGAFSESRPYFTQALRLSPTNRYLWIRYLITLLPLQLIGRLRHLKRYKHKGMKNSDSAGVKP